MTNKKRFWLVVTSFDNYEISKNEMLLGFSQKWEKQVSVPSEEDFVLIYISKKSVLINSNSLSQFISVTQFSGNAFFLEDTPWIEKKGKRYPICRKVTRFIEANEPVRVHDYIEELAFIKKPNGWAAYFLTPIKEIPEQDFELITNRMGINKLNI